MRYDQLEHAIRAACDVSGDDELLVFGSQAVLGSFPEAPEVVRASMEVDLQPKNRPEMTDVVDGALGQESQFHVTHGFYVHGIEISAATLPDGWFERTVRVSHPTRTLGHTGFCLEIYDLAASKLVAFREKDRLFVATLLTEGLIDHRKLIERLQMLRIDPVRIGNLVEWVRTIESEELERGGPS